METNVNEREGEIVGLPTLLAIYDVRIEAQQVLDGLKNAGYPMEDVCVYYRVKGSDQVIDATTGHVAAGQSLNEDELKRSKLENVDTLVLLHPNAQQAEAAQQVLATLGTPDIKYATETHAESNLEGVTRHQEAK